jgi:hypothetical protein
MGLFNKPTRDDNERTISDAHPHEPKRNGNGSGRHEQVLVHPMTPQPQPPRAPIPTPAPQVTVTPVPVAPQKFTIEETVHLLKQLPSRENDAVRRAVHMTLAAMNVDRGGLVESAATKDVQLQARIDKLRAEVDRHNALALAATKEIAQLEAERSELGATRNWLLDQQQYDNPPTTAVIDRTIRT